MWTQLMPHQREAIDKMRNGCILCGGVGTGKSITSLAYYFREQGGDLDWSNGYQPMDDISIQDLYIITTARKRDTLEWESELSRFLITNDLNTKIYRHNVVIDSWNNIGKYTDVKNAFFIFDEQRVVGSGSWVKSFLKITKSNNWILLSATPGDTWMDYVPVFVANGFYKNKTEFLREHVVFSRFSKFPKVDRYLNTKRLERLRSRILVIMEFERHTTSYHEDIYVEYDHILYKSIFKDRWNIWENKPFQNASELCYGLRKVVNSDESRLEAVLDIFKEHPRLIVFYNFDYELEMLKNLDYGRGVEIAEWNGHAHQPIPESMSWVYLVQYNAGAEGWNCIKTDTILFYSQNYSYKIMVQSAGRIDRLNTPYTDLHYYHLKSRASIDIAIAKALKEKKQFNTGAFIGKFEGV